MPLSASIFLAICFTPVPSRECQFTQLEEGRTNTGYCFILVSLLLARSGSGRTQDRFRLIISPLTSFLVSQVIEEIKRRRESDFRLSILLIHFCRSFYEMNSRQNNNLSIQSSIRLWMLAK